MAIGQFLNAILFKKHNSHSIAQSKFFSSMMLKPVMTFTVTMLDEWKVPYMRHLININSFEKMMKKYNTYAKITTKLLENVHTHAGIGPIRGNEQAGRVPLKILQNELCTYEAGFEIVNFKDEDNDKSDNLQSGDEGVLAFLEPSVATSSASADNTA
ncbi:hypothetical protein NM688_g5428 [Phlebia brevispora]|uniref:Uncharacterized protein n=1 Tax=Phlebia brevispora TaxID=194682 RepID=A0ACC1SVR7_9APHY|nr:hypothetical protein NM688_g5428 [Phlebia brevispora]